MESGSQSTESKGAFGFLWRMLPTLKNPLPNPGKYEDYNVEARSVLQIAEVFDGLRFELNKGLSPVFAVNHNITLGNAQTPAGTYEFGSNYATNTALLISRIDTAGNLQARVHHQITPQLLLRSQAQLVNQPHVSSGQIDADYRGSDWCGSARVGTHGSLALSYMQSVTERLALGIASEYQGRLYGQGRHMSAVSAAFRYATQDFIATGQMTNYGALVLSYTQRVHENVSLSSEIQMYAGGGSRDSLVNIGMEYRLRVGNFKAYITSTGHGTAYMERKLTPEVSFLLCGDIDNKKKDYKFGIGLVVGGQ